MNLLRRFRTYLLISVTFALLSPIVGYSQAAPVAPVSAAPQLRDGQHDFDFHFGSFHTHIRRLLHPLTGSKTWVELDGTVTTRKLWGGRANIEELDAGSGEAHLKGMTLFLYNPEAHQWSQAFANISDGTMNAPLIGEFKNGRGEFYDREIYKGRTILVRFVWFDITADSHRVEQSFSDDGGKTWEPNFVATLNREKQPAPSQASVMELPAPTVHDGQHDWDFHLTNWTSQIQRLQHPLAGSTTWLAYDGALHVQKLWDGRASIEELRADGPSGHMEDLTLFLYNPESHQWNLMMASPDSGTIGRPMVGEFKDGRGEFYDQEEFHGKMIFVRFVWSDITDDTHRFEQSFSADGGKTWEPNFIAKLTRVKE